MAECKLQPPAAVLVGFEWQQSEAPELLQKSGFPFLLKERGRAGKLQLCRRAGVALQGPALSPSTSSLLSKAASFQLSKYLQWVEPLPGWCSPS